MDSLLRESAPLVLGALVRRFRDFAACEDAWQEASLAAARQWPRAGLPENPRGWLLQVAKRRLLDQRRGDAARGRREEAVAEEGPYFLAPVALGDDAALDPGDTLILLFLCCHPALTTASAIALTLRAVGGLGTAEIAKAFLVPEATMAQRISRAKQQIRASGLPFALPDAGERARRLDAVLHVLYLIFNEGYTASAGADLARVDLSAEAIRLTRDLHRLLPDDDEVGGLLALMLLTDARRAARTGPDGELIPLDEQDRSLWDRAAIAEGLALVAARPPGPAAEYRLQAAIAALHDQAGHAGDTDWPRILMFYEVLGAISASPVVALNGAVAHAMVHGAAAGLERLDQLAADPRLLGHHRLAAARAHLLERLGRRQEALARYREAAEATTSLPERDYLLRRASRLLEAR